MDGLSGVASVIAIIDLSAKIISLCAQYSAAVMDAKEDVKRMQNKIFDIMRILDKLKELLAAQDESRLPNTQGLFDSLKQCLQELEKMRMTLELGKSLQTMNRFGFRALKWPFTSKQMNKTILTMEGYKRTFSLALQIDQTAVVFDIDNKLNLAQLPVAIGASYDSHDEEHNARCLPNTRTELLDQITNWASGQDSKPILWLNGMAGTGKSTIARTVAQLLARRRQLGASYFFKRGEGERSYASRFFTTVASDLIVREPDMLVGINKALKEDPKIAQRAFRDQFEKLILQPLLQTKPASSRKFGYVIVVDALDECEQEEDARAILQLLARMKEIQQMPLRIIITSRPEFHIRLGFKQMPNGIYQNLVLHEVPKAVMEHDMRIFLEHELSLIREDRMLTTDWPAPAQIMALVELVVPLFVYADTVCRYVNTRGNNPKERLKKILRYQKSTFSRVDGVYLQILNQLLAEQEKDEHETWLYAFRKVVGSIVVLERPLSVQSLASLLQLPEEEIMSQLEPLHSVLNIPESDGVPVRVLHLSFREFLIDPQKQGKNSFWVDERSKHKELASWCVDLMSRPGGLRQNMCGLSGPGVWQSDVDDRTVASNLSPALQYACCYWTYHLKQSQPQIVDGDMIHLFLQKHFLHWLEAMSLIRETARCIYSITVLQAYLDPAAKIVSSFLKDAERFILRSQSILIHAPLQVYYSALLFAPGRSVVRRTFENQLPPQVRVLSAEETEWSACRSTLEGHDAFVNAVDFSPDGQLIASASDDTTVRLWEVATGDCRSTLEGHTSRVVAVKFSPDGQLIASASADKTVCIWERTSGTCRSMLKGHTYSINAVAFSPDGELIASASTDNTIRLWEVGTGTCRSTLEGHTLRVVAVAFSPDGQLIASASRDSTILLWNVATGICRSTLEGHSRNVSAVAFSPDGQLIASASYDTTVRLWEVATGTCRRTLGGDASRVVAVTFSPDGQLIGTASEDKVVRLWEVETGLCRNTLEGHSWNVATITFSSCGQLLASASYDSTVCLWDVRRGVCRTKLEGHTSHVKALAFSPDGQLVVSASYDKTLRLWETVAEKKSSKLEYHASFINAVTFSPDGQLVASASEDKTLRLWEAATGVCRNVLEGHSEYVDIVKFSPDGQLVASASGDETVRLWEVATGTCRTTLGGHDKVSAIAFSPDGQRIALGTRLGIVQLLDAATGARYSTLKGHSSRITAVVFSQNGQLVTTVCLDNTIRLWESATGVCRRTLEGPSEQISCMAWSLNGPLPHTDYGDSCPQDTQISVLPSGVQHPPSHILIQDQWILRGQQRVLWLPPEYRSTKTAVHEHMVCLGLTSGRVVLIKIPPIM